MTTYTVQIEASSDGQIWQALHPSETVEVEGTATDAAQDTWANQNLTAESDETVQHRILVWDGDTTNDADDEKPTLVWYPDES